jgi:hypothetical protein
MKATAKAGAALTVVLLLVLALVAGCTQKQFVIYEQQIVKELGAQKEPRNPSDTFSPQDRAAYFYFKYRDAPSNTTLRGEITYTGQGAEPIVLTKDLVLVPGSHAAYCGLEIDEGQLFPAGAYQVELFQGETSLGSPRTFTVLGGPAVAAATMATAPAPAAERSAVKRVSAEERLRQEAARHGASAP